MDYRERITLDPEIRFGKPILRGTRITVGDVLSYLAGGMSEDEILDDFPQLSREDILACLAFAADRERRLASVARARTAGTFEQAPLWRESGGSLTRGLEDLFPGSALSSLDLPNL